MEKENVYTMYARYTFDKIKLVWGTLLISKSMASSVPFAWLLFPARGSRKHELLFPISLSLCLCLNRADASWMPFGNYFPPTLLHSICRHPELWIRKNRKKKKKKMRRRKWGGDENILNLSFRRRLSSGGIRSMQSRDTRIQVHEFKSDRIPLGWLNGSRETERTVNPTRSSSMQK